MNIVFFLVPVALCIGIFFVGCFIWAVRHGQFDDMETPAYRVLLGDKKKKDKSSLSTDNREEGK